MKKLLLLLATIMMAVSCYDDSAILDRLNALEKSNIDMVAQMSAVKTSINSLESVDKEIKNAITELQKQGGGDYQAEIDALKEKDKNLEKGINDLKTSLTKEINDTKDWAEATFATIEKYNLIVTDLSELKTLVGSNFKELSDKIDESVSSIKDWVKEVLKAYYTSEEVDAKIKELQERLDNFDKRLDGLEEQIEAIKGSISSLEQVDSILKKTIDSLKNSCLGDASLIDALEQKVQSLEKGINDLKDSLDSNISDTKDWVESTFATIEQYNSIVSDLSELQELVGSNFTELSNKIDESINSIKSWVNEVLKAYYTSEEVDAKLQELKNQLDSLQGKLNDFFREFKISFNETEIGILPGGTTTVNYKIVGATDKTIVKAMGQRGWSATVNQMTDSTGTIIVQAPDPLIEDEIIVIVYDGEYRTIMSSINFVTGVITPSQDAIDVPKEGGTFEFIIETNLEYKVIIPEAAQSWLSVNPGTKAIRKDYLSIKVTANEGSARRTNIQLQDTKGNVLKTINVLQQGVISNYPAFNEIWYTTTDNTKIDLSDATVASFGAALTSNVYEDGKGVMTFDGDVTKIGDNAFSMQLKLETIYLPSTVTSIGANAFNACTHLSSVYCASVTPPDGGNNMFKENASDRLIFVPQGSVEEYRYAYRWNSYSFDIYGYDNINGNPVINLFSNKVSVNNMKGAKSIGYAVSLPIEGKDISVSSSASWLTVKSEQNGVISFSYPRNDESSERSATVTVSYEGATSVNFTVSQTKAPDMWVTVKGVDIPLIKVEKGTFVMGGTPEQGNADDDEKPIHVVILTKDFYIGQYEVTQELWEAVMGSNPSYHTDNSQFPVECVSWNDICSENGFLSQLNAATGQTFTLPTEAQWEYAARGGNKMSTPNKKYSGSDNADDVAWHHDNSGNQSYPVGEKLPNELGIYDMSGNVYEWCSDWYGTYTSNAQTDPAGPDAGSDRVFRGGSNWHIAESCRVSNRDDSDPDYRNKLSGLRLVLVL